MDLATTHLSADLDGLASLVAIRLLEGPLELVLPGSMDVTSRKFWSDHGDDLPPILPLGEVRERLKGEAPGRLIVVDTADPTRIGEIGEWVEHFEEVLAFDNHPPTEGDLPRAPMPWAGACISGLVLRLQEEGRRPTPLQAGLFLLGIHMDTGHFTFGGTTAKDHEAARICLEWGAPGEWIGRYLPKGFTSQQLERLSRMAESVEYLEEGSVAVTVLELESYEPDLSVLLEQLRAAEGWRAAFLLAGSGGRVDVIGRSRGPLDVGAVLRSLGGGGHPEAGSATLRSMTLHEARSLLRQALREVEGSREVGEVAASPFVSLSATASIEAAAERIRQRRIDSLPLTRGRGKELRYVGLVSRRDVEGAMAHGLGKRRVEEISLGPPPWLPPEAPLDEARRVLISGGGRLVMVGTPPQDAQGILTRGTVLRALEEPALARSSSIPGRREVEAKLREGLGPRWDLAERLGEVASGLGMGIHLVGGSVRDLFLGAPVRDVDLVVEGAAPEVAREAQRRFGGRVASHAEFGTATWILAGERVDIASARAEHYPSPASLPRVELHAGLRQDLFRRDFTMNAIAVSVDPKELGEVRDPFGGIADLQAGVLRVLHGLSFHDDPTRAFRAARFAARFDFRVSPETLGLIDAARKAGAFDKLGKERLGAELDRILDQPEVVQAFRLLRGWKLLPKIHPRFRGGRELLQRVGKIRDTRNRFASALGDELPSQADILWIELGGAIPKADRKEWGRMVPRGGARLRRFVWGAEKVRKAQRKLPGVRDAADAGFLLHSLDVEELIYAVATSERKETLAWVEWWLLEGRGIQPAIDGSDLLALGYPQGKEMGKALLAARAAAWRGEGREAQLSAAEEVLRP